ncbi:MAG: glycosyltransferase family 4 protein [Mycobacterium sp.]|nr:glycosyltransferase family 4 protein [Mycobacterium sp.]
MALGKPVIASRIGGLPEIVADGETGIVVTPEDSDELRAAIARLVADPALAARMGAAGQDRVTSFYASTVVREIESVYQEVLA